jgi:hypothetical protein
MEPGEILKNLPFDPAQIISEQEIKADKIETASAVPLPGPLRKAFAFDQDIEVGPVKIRPFFDMDWEILTTLNHPIKDLRGGGKSGYEPSGPQARLAAWLFSHPIRGVVSEIKKGKDHLQALADDQFMETQMQEHLEISTAIFEQLKRYWEPAIRFAAEHPDDLEKKTMTSDPQVKG